MRRSLTTIGTGALSFGIGWAGYGWTSPLSVTGEEPVASTSTLSEAPECEARSDPVEIGGLEKGGTALRRGALARVASGFISSGIESEGSGWGTPTAGRPHDPVPRLRGPDGNRIPLPADSLAVSRTGILTPIPLGRDRWGIVWGESSPPEAWSRVPPHRAVTHLWFAERTEEGWGPPRLLAEAGHLGWGLGRRLQAREDTGTLAMVTAHATPMFADAASILFGRIEEDLAAVPIPGYPRALHGAFDLTENGTVLAAVIARGEGAADDPFHILVLSSRDGRSWSVPEVVHTIEGRGFHPGGLRLYVDAEGDAHVLWEENPTSVLAATVNHLILRRGETRWSTVKVPELPGASFGWVAGIDRCGQLTLVTAWYWQDESGAPLPSLEFRYWEGDAWSPMERRLPTMIAMDLFDGIDGDGTWHIGWTGLPLPFTPPEPQASAPRLGIWALTP